MDLVKKKPTQTSTGCPKTIHPEPEFPSDIFLKNHSQCLQSTMDYQTGATSPTMRWGCKKKNKTTILVVVGENPETDELGGASGGKERRETPLKEKYLLLQAQNPRGAIKAPSAQPILQRSLPTLFPAAWDADTSTREGKHSVKKRQ